MTPKATAGSSSRPARVQGADFNVLMFQFRQRVFPLTDTPDNLKLKLNLENEIDGLLEHLPVNAKKYLISSQNEKVSVMFIDNRATKFVEVRSVIAATKGWK